MSQEQQTPVAPIGGLLFLLAAGAAYVGSLVAGWLEFSGAHVVAAVALVAAAYYRRRAVIRHQILGWLELDATRKVQEHRPRETFDASEDYWPKILLMVDQVLDYERLVFFERVPGEGRLRDAKAVGCGFEDVAAEHRDLSREPFATAARADLPSPVEGFLRPRPGEKQLLLPLLVGSHVQGFWALALSEGSMEENPKLESLLTHFAKEIAVVVFLHQQVAFQKRLEEQAGGSLPTGDDQVLASEIHNSIMWLEDRLVRTRRLLRSLGEALVVYDLLGHVLSVSAEMSRVLEKAGVDPYRLTPVELAVELTGADETVARGWMRQAVQRETTVRPLSSFDPESGKYYVFRVHPLTYAEEAPRDAAAEAREPELDVQGIIVELVDVTESRTLSERTKSTWRDYERELRNSLEGFALAGQMLVMPELPEEQRIEIGNMVRDKVAGTSQLLEQTQDLVTREWERASAVRAYAVDAVRILKDARHELAEHLADKQAEVLLTAPGDLQKVAASPGRLKDLFVLVLGLLVEDVKEGGEIKVEVAKEADTARFDFLIEAHGLPVNEDGVFDETGAYDLGLRQLRNCMTWAASWGGLLDFESSMEQGVRIHLTLNVYR